MTPSPEEQPAVLGKYQALIGYLYYQFTYFVFYFCFTHCMYVLITLNYNWMIFYTIVMVVQSRAKRSQMYIDFVSNTLQFRKGLKSTQIIYEEEITSEKRCLFGFHPHGILASAIPVFMNYPTGPFKYCVGLSSNAMLLIPFVGFLLRWWGIEPVDPKNMKKLMRSGKNIALVPGGFEEATLTVQD